MIYVDTFVYSLEGFKLTFFFINLIKRNKNVIKNSLLDISALF